MKEKIQGDFVVAYKAGDKVKKNLLGVVLSEIKLEEGRKVKMDDTAVLSLIRKMSQDCDIIINNAQDEAFKALAVREKEILVSYLPQLMTEEEIKEKVDLICLTMCSPNMGLIMKEFNTRYKGKADNSVVSKVVKEKLNEK